MSKRITVTIAEMSREPKQPRRFEKKSMRMGSAQFTGAFERDLSDALSVRPSEPVRIAVVVLVFAVGGALFLSSESGYRRTLGWSLLLLFGGGGAAYVALELLRRRRGLWGGRLAKVPGAAGAEPGFVFRFRAVALAAATAGAATMAAGCLLLVPLGEPAGLLCAIVFAVLALVGLTRLMRPPTLTFTPTRFICRGVWGTREWPWSEVNDALVHRLEMTMPDEGTLPVRPYVDSPERRALIGTAEELERLRSELF